MRTRWRSLILIASVLLLAGTGLIATGTFGRSTPNSTAAHYAILGNAVFDKERTREANREAFVLFDKALALDPNLVSALIGYARAILVNVTEGWLHQSERAMLLNQAETALQRAIKLEPNNGRAYQWYGNLWRARGAPEQAVRSLEQAVTLMPTHAWVYADLARAKIEVGRADEAIRDFETAIRLGPKDVALFIWCFQAGMAAVHVGAYDAALQWFQKSEDANPAYVHNMRPWRAIANAALGRYDEARAFLEEHLAHSPGLTLARWDQRFPRSNTLVGQQRERIAEILRHLGVPDGRVQTGSVR
jgi:tetratricopeptide (TPR) repeat protein